MKKLLFALMLLFPLLCAAQGVRNPSFNAYEIRVVCKGEILLWGELASGGHVNIKGQEPVEVFYKVIFKKCDTDNPEKEIMEILPKTNYKASLPNGWKMVKVQPNIMQNLPLQICTPGT